MENNVPLSKAQWKRSDRTTCPKCGSSHWKKKVKFAQSKGMKIFSVVIGVICLGFGFLSKFFWILGALTILSAFTQPKKLRKCEKCGKVWKYIREPHQSAQEKAFP